MQIEPVRTFYPISLRFGLILYSHLFLGALDSFFPSGFPNEIQYFCLPRTCHMPRPSHSPLFDHPNNEPLITQISPVSRYLLPLMFLAPKTYTLHGRVQGSIPERRSVWVFHLWSYLYKFVGFCSAYAFGFPLLRSFQGKWNPVIHISTFLRIHPELICAPKGWNQISSSAPCCQRRPVYVLPLKRNTKFHTEKHSRQRYIVLFIVIFKFFDSRQEDKRLKTEC